MPAQILQLVAGYDLDASEDRFRAYFDGSSDCMFHVRVEADGRFTYVDVNPACLAAAGLSRDEMLGREPLELLGPEKGAEMTAGLQAVLRTGQPFRYEPTWEMATGTSVYDAVYTPLRDRTGLITGILGVARDITEHRRLEAALHHAQKVEAVGQLAAGVVHDFNNILAVFQACLRLIDGDVKSGRGRRVIEQGHVALDRGKALTEWLTGFVRQEPVTVSTMDLNAAMDQVGAMLRQVLTPKIHLTMELSPDLQPALGNANEFALAILNLGINARDAMPDGGMLRLSTRNETVTQKQSDDIEPGCYVVVEMADTGHGIPQEVLARVMEPFFTTKPSGRGTGLGLPMVHGIVRRAGGGLRITSVEGEGTQVCLYFPLDRKENTTQQRENLSQQGSAQLLQ